MAGKSGYCQISLLLAMNRDMGKEPTKGHLRLHASVAQNFLNLNPSHDHHQLLVICNIQNTPCQIYDAVLTHFLHDHILAAAEKLSFCLYDCLEKFEVLYMATMSFYAVNEVLYHPF